ncbi:MAG: deoxyribodipyrimidine photo-lyase [Armatimonadota bacterium]
MIQPTRLQSLNRLPVREGRYVLYWMQASQRADYNHALEHAIREANRLGQPLLVVFGLTADFPDANERHYRFMLEGLAQTRQALARRNIQLVILLKAPPQAALEVAREASLLVTDRGYLRIQKQWREEVARKAQCSVVQMESDVVVPVESASAKEEVGARTLRPKLQKLLDQYLVPLKQSKPKFSSLDLPFQSLDLSNLPALLRKLKIPREPSNSRFTGGTAEGLKLLDQFLRDGLPRYDTFRNDALADAVSRMSPYLHFGQLSPLQIALAVQEETAPDVAVYLEQLIVRRELSMNFVNHNPGYDSYEQAVPQWARKTLFEHARDPRPRYSLEQLENSQTDDPYWNAMMREMALTGYLHNYLRMYWGKRIIEWSANPDEAFNRIAHLNNKHFVDGRDPVSWGNVAWCFGKHDRPWPPRPVFGTVRSMNANGLRRKFKADEYVRRIAEMG